MNSQNEDETNLELSEAVVVKDASRCGINVWIGILGLHQPTVSYNFELQIAKTNLAMLFEHAGSDFESLVHQLDDGGVFQLRTTLAEFLKGNKSGIGVPKNTMAISWDDLTTFECLPEILFDVIVCDVIAEFLLHGELPSEDLLVGET